MKRLYLSILKWFLPVLFISYMAGITLFTHSHVVNGVTIVHSHPFKKGTKHEHTSVEFQLIHFLTHVQTTDAGICSIYGIVGVYASMVSSTYRQSCFLCRSGVIEGTSFALSIVSSFRLNAKEPLF